MRRNQKGFTLIELLIVVAIIGIIAAIAIPNLLNAIDRGKQKRTMADLRSMGTAIEEYSIDNNFYPERGHDRGPRGPGDPVLHPRAAGQRRLGRCVRGGLGSGSVHAGLVRQEPDRCLHLGLHRQLRQDRALLGRHHLLERIVRAVARR